MMSSIFACFLVAYWVHLHCIQVRIGHLGSIIRIICDMDVYTKFCCICRDLSVKASHSDEYEQKELRSGVGNKSSRTKVGLYKLKSQTWRGKTEVEYIAEGVRHLHKACDSTVAPWMSTRRVILCGDSTAVLGWRLDGLDEVTTRHQIRLAIVSNEGSGAPERVSTFPILLDVGPVFLIYIFPDLIF